MRTSEPISAQPKLGTIRSWSVKDGAIESDPAVPTLFNGGEPPTIRARCSHCEQPIARVRGDVWLHMDTQRPQCDVTGWDSP